MLKLNRDDSLKEYIEKIIFNHLLIENGNLDGKKDYLLEKDINNTYIEYILNTSLHSYGDSLNKYNVAYYYAEIAKMFNKIAIKRKISRNELWKIIRENIIFKNCNKTEHRIYKNIFRGEIIPSPGYVYKTLQNNEDLPTYLSIIYLDEVITPELEEAYRKIKIE